MVKVSAMWELGWNTPIKEYDLWRFPMRDFEVDEWYMTPVSGIHAAGIQERANLEEIIAENPDLLPIFCDERGTTMLSEFEHPENALYVFGRSNYSPFIHTAEQGHSLKIETPRTKGGLLWGHQAASIILYDRFMKR